MRKINTYVDDMYKPSFIALILALNVITIALGALAVLMREELLVGNLCLVYLSPKIVEEILFHSSILFSVIFGIDFMERRKRR